MQSGHFLNAGVAQDVLVNQSGEVATEQTREVYNKVANMRFIEELATGTLSKDRFANYIAQD
ncbi:MAG: hypothetical protein LBP35_05760 [Candidatus Ancillula trichonymphae]|nr:hypothetical protein [Candidatus Ancillula trichonymphae]